MQTPQLKSQDFNLLTLNPRKAARLLWSYVGMVVVVGLLFVTHHVAVAFGALFLLAVWLGIFLGFQNRLVGEATRISVGSDS